MSLPIPLSLVRSRRDLEHCAPKLQSFYEYWDSRRAGRSMPARSDIDPTEMRQYLGMVMLVDVVPDERRFVYRLVGTKEVEGRGRDPTGKPVAQGQLRRLGGSTRFYDTIVGNRLPVLFVGEYVPRPGRQTKEQVLGLPLSNDDRSNMILVWRHRMAEGEP
jgi:hypothetical protein